MVRCIKWRGPDGQALGMQTSAPAMHSADHENSRKTVGFFDLLKVREVRGCLLGAFGRRWGAGPER